MEASPASINDGRVDAKELRLGSNGHAASIFLKTFLNRAEIFRLHPDASSAGRQRGLCSDLASTGSGIIRTPDSLPPHASSDLPDTRSESNRGNASCFITLYQEIDRQRPNGTVRHINFSSADSHPLWPSGLEALPFFQLFDAPRELPRPHAQSFHESRFELVHAM